MFVKAKESEWKGNKFSFHFPLPVVGLRTCACACVKGIFYACLCAYFGRGCALFFLFFFLRKRGGFAVWGRLSYGSD